VIASFNLIDEPWIPCYRPVSSGPVLLGIRDTLAQAGELREISAASPIETVAIHRLLLAILHRNFGPKDAEAWSRIWYAGSFDQAILRSYFKIWYDRFDLFHPERPFYQCASLKEEYAKPATLLVPELASGNNATLFDHTVVESDLSLIAARAASALLAAQCFSVGGLVSLEKGQDPRQLKSARGGALVNTAVALVRGETLFRSLLLNLHRRDRYYEEPFASDISDSPAWERNSEPLAGDRYPHGYLDYLTWQPRRVRLIPHLNASALSVRTAIVMKGEQLPEDWTLAGRETMTAFQRLTGEKPWRPVSFSADRVIWRDSLALFESISDRRQRPKILNWLSDLTPDPIEQSATLRLELLGARTDQAKWLFWRHEHMPLPLGYLKSTALVGQLRLALSITEQAASALRDSFFALAAALLGPGADKKAISRLRNSVSTENQFWSCLDAEFSGFLVQLAADVRTNDYGEEVFGDNIMPVWRKKVERAAEDDFAEALRRLGSTPRILKAGALVEARFRSRLQKINTLEVDIDA
jgi:CRISPR system Cascade subunit CasA